MQVPIMPKIHKEGWIFIAIFAAVAVLLSLASSFLGWLGFILTAWCASFFRDPERMTPVRRGLIISPADGFVQMITKVPPPEELGLKGDGWTRVSIFLSVFDVHINRIPIDGTITKSVYHPGKFFNASLDKASVHNERQSLAVELEDGREVAFVQIAGLIARRIRCDVFEGQKVRAGERFGLIRFGSRVDVYLPKGVNPLLIEGQRAVAGETIIADLDSSEEQRVGEVR